MKKNLHLLSILFITISCAVQENNEWISTTNEEPWVIHNALIKEKNLISKPDISIQTNNVLQIIDGFGACFNELEWDALNILNPKDKETVIKEMFDTVIGCKFNICRMPIGANDYAFNWYSFDETPDDFDMKHFSIDRDKKSLMPFIKKAKKYNPSIKIWASPWSPPAWMKQNKHYACRPDVVNDLTESLAGKEMQTQFIMERKYLEAYAKYFSYFISAYKKVDIDIYAVHVQNEMNSCQNFPSCIWNPTDLAIFIGDYLGPQFFKDKLNTEIWYGTIERPQLERIDTVMQNTKAAGFITGFGFQWAGKDAISIVNKKYPDYKLMQTESECGNGSNDWKAAEHTFELMKHYFDNGANAYIYWNMVLNETGKSQWGWKQNSLISIDSQTKSVKYNPEFYLIKHFSYFIEPGACLLELDKNDPNCLAFKNKNSVIIIYYNKTEAKEISIKLDNKFYKVNLEEKSFNTFGRFN